MISTRVFSLKGALTESNISTFSRISRKCKLPKIWLGRRCRSAEKSLALVRRVRAAHLQNEVGTKNWFWSSEVSHQKCSEILGPYLAGNAGPTGPAPWLTRKRTDILHNSFCRVGRDNEEVCTCAKSGFLRCETLSLDLPTRAMHDETNLFWLHHSAFLGDLSGPLDRLNATLPLLHPRDRYTTSSAIGHVQAGILNRLVLNRLGRSTARCWRYSAVDPFETSAKQKRDRGCDSQPRPRQRLNSQPQGATKSRATQCKDHVTESVLLITRALLLFCLQNRASCRQGLLYRVQFIGNVENSCEC